MNEKKTLSKNIHDVISPQKISETTLSSPLPYQLQAKTQSTQKSASVIDEKTLQAITFIVLGNFDKALVLLNQPTEIHFYLKALIALLCHDKQRLSDNEYLLEKYPQYSMLLSIAKENSYSEFTLVDSKIIDENQLNPSEAVVLARCENIDKFAFFSVYAVIDDTKKQLMMLSEQEGKDIFFTNRKAICYDSKIFPESGELGIWRGKSKETKQSIKFELTQKMPIPLYIFHDIPCTSNDHEQVRQTVKNYVANTLVKPIFRLKDGYCIRPQHEITNYQRDLLNEPFLLWNKLMSITIDNEKYFLGELPAEDNYYDCAEFTSSLKKVIKYKKEQLDLPLTKRQVDQLAQFISIEEDEKISAKLSRCQKVLTQYQNNLIPNEELISEIIDLPDIKQQIEQEKQQKLNNYIEEQKHQYNTVKTQVNDLKKEKEKLIADIKVQKERLREKKQEIHDKNKELAESIQNTFKMAQQQGEQVLSQLALYQSFFKPQTTTVNDSSESLFFIEGTPKKLENSLAEQLRKIEIKKREAAAIEAMVKIAVECGQLITFSGSIAKQVARVCADYFSKQTISIITMPVACIDRKLFVGVLEQHPDWDCIILDGINLSDFKLIANPIYELLTERIISKESNTPCPCIIGIYETIPAALPIKNEFSQLGLIINTDLRLTDDFELLELSELKDKAREFVVQQQRDTVLWKKGFNKFCKQLEQQLEGQEEDRDLHNMLWKSMVEI